MYIPGMADIRFMHDGGAQEQGVYKTLDDAVEAAQWAVEATRGVVFWSPALRSSGGQQARAVVGLGVPGEGVYPFEDTHDVLAWWQNLPSGVREALETEPGKVLTPNEVETVPNTRPHGLRAISAAWVGTEDEDQGTYRLVQQLQRFVRAMTS